MNNPGGIGMNGQVRGMFPWILFCGIAIVCLVIVAEDVSAVERPTGRGPYDVGFFEEDYVPTYHECVTTIPHNQTDPMPLLTDPMQVIQRYYTDSDKMTV
jgi:hypothetical protein